MSKIDFCGICNTGHKVDSETGLCERHGKPVRNVMMKCIHCTGRTITNKTMTEVVEVEAPYGGICPKCGNPCVGEFGEPVLILEDDCNEIEVEEGYHRGSSDGCSCRLERDEDGSVRLYHCMLHFKAKDNRETLDELCRDFGYGCTPAELEGFLLQRDKERDAALEALGVEDNDHDENMKAIGAVDVAVDARRLEMVQKLLELCGLSEEEWFKRCYDSYYAGRFDPVEFLTARLRELAPERLTPTAGQLLREALAKPKRRQKRKSA